MRFFFIYPGQKFKRGTVEIDYSHDLDIQILVRETDAIRTEKWWDEEFPKLIEKLYEIVPGHDYSTHHKFTHDIKDCPEGSLASVGTSAPLNGLKYKDADFKEQEV